MKKSVLLLFKFVVGLIPIKLRKLLKRNLYLTAFYSRVLRQAGLIQNVQSVEAKSVAYSKNIQLQSELINRLTNVNFSFPCLVIIVVEVNKNRLAKTLESIANLTDSNQRVFFYCAENKKAACSQVLKKLNYTLPPNYMLSDLNTNRVLLDESIGPCFVLFEGDSLHPDYARVINNKLLLTTDIAYVDVDIKSEDGERHSPEFYPDWNPDLQLSSAYIQSGIWLRDIQLLLSSSHYKLSYTYISEWFARQYLADKSYKIQHIPFVLLHRTERTKTYDKTLLEILSAKARVQFKQAGEVLALNWLTASYPLVSIIIPTKNAQSLVKACIESIFKLTTYRNFEILLVDNNSDESESLAYFDSLSSHPQIKVLKYPFGFNYSAINNFAVRHASGEIIAMVNNDIEVIEPDWLTYMVGHTMRSDIGCVGAKLLYANGLVQHAGVVMGYGGGAGHAHKYFPADHPGYLNRLSATQNFSAVTAACLLVKKADYDSVGGLNETEFKIAFNDVDFCLRVLGLGRRNLYCAEAVLYHHESVSRGHEDTAEKLARFNSEVGFLQAKWQNFISHDPAYNINLTLRAENFAVKESLLEYHYDGVSSEI